MSSSGIEGNKMQINNYSKIYRSMDQIRGPQRTPIILESTKLFETLPCTAKICPIPKKR